MGLSFSFSGPSGGIPGVDDPNPFSPSIPDMDIQSIIAAISGTPAVSPAPAPIPAPNIGLGGESAVNILNPNPIQLLGAEITAANPFTGGPMASIGGNITGFGDFLSQFSDPTSDPLGGMIPSTPVPGGFAPAPGSSIEDIVAAIESGAPSPGPSGFPDTTPLQGALTPALPPVAPSAEAPAPAPSPTPFSDEISQVLDEARGVRAPFAQQFQDLLSGRFDPATSPVFVAQREAIEDQFAAAEDQIRATLPRGNSLNAALARLSSAKARSISDTLSGILGQEREKAFQFATGQTATGLSAREGSERLNLTQFLGEKGLDIQQSLGQQGIDLQKLQLENAIQQAIEKREEESITDTLEFIFDLLGL